MLKTKMNPVHLNKNANKSKKVNYLRSNKGDRNPYDISNRITLPLKTPDSKAVKKSISINGDDCLWNTMKQSSYTVPTVNYKSAADYYLKTAKESRKVAKLDDGNLFKEIDRLFRDKFECKTFGEPEKSQFCLNLKCQLKGVKVECFRSSISRKIRGLVDSDHLDDVLESEDENLPQEVKKSNLHQRNVFDTIPLIPPYKFVFSTPLKQKLHFVTNVDLSGLESNFAKNFTPWSSNVRYPGTPPVFRFEDDSFLYDPNHNLARIESIKKADAKYYKSIETPNFQKILQLINSPEERFQKRITSPESQIYKRSKIYFTPPDISRFEMEKLEISMIGSDEKKHNRTHNKKPVFLVEPRKVTFEAFKFSPPFIFLNENYCD